jgi:ERCC4-type nuclease
VLIDTREKNKNHIVQYLNKNQIKYRYQKLEAGDYSSLLILNGEEVQLNMAIERKANISELCNNFGKERERFKREWERSLSNNTKMSLLIENANFYEDVNLHLYRSLMHPNALLGSLSAWSKRYNFEVVPKDRSESGEYILDTIIEFAEKYLLEWTVEQINKEKVVI